MRFCSGLQRPSRRAPRMRRQRSDACSWKCLSCFGRQSSSLRATCTYRLMEFLVLPCEKSHRSAWRIMALIFVCMSCSMDQAISYHEAVPVRFLQALHLLSPYALNPYPKPCSPRVLSSKFPFSHTFTTP